MLKTRRILLIHKRWKSGKQKAALGQKRTATQRALSSFDDFYGSVFGLRWNNMRAALLSEQKYVALVNNFGDTKPTINLLESDGAINIKSLIDLAKQRETEDNPDALQRNATYKVDHLLQDILKSQEIREKQLIYPPDKDNENLLDHPNADTAHEGTSESKQTANPFQVGRSIDEAAQIDHSRMVDYNYGPGDLVNYIPASKLKGMEDWLLDSDHYKYYPTTTEFPLKIELESEFTFPENVILYTYEMGNCSRFKKPQRCVTGCLSHYLMDGASILAPLVLDVKHGEAVLDTCAAPGGKSLLMLQSMHPDILVCNDVQRSRVRRIEKVMNEYISDFEDRWLNKRCILMQKDGRIINHYNMYDKILVDVPCTIDRHSLSENDNNIFKPSRLKERLRIPELQAGILANCIRLLKPGGSLVYSTCSLSPVQNDGVVHMAMQSVYTDYNITVTVKDLSPVVRLFSDIFKFEYPKGLKYGQMIVPFLPANYGPAYFSKITRDE